MASEQTSAQSSVENRATPNVADPAPKSAPQIAPKLALEPSAKPVSETSPQPAPARPPSLSERAESLIAQNCQACHLLPQPSDLPKSTWPFVLDWMGNYLGHQKLEGDLGVVTDRKLIPAEPKVSVEELGSIRDYYLENAPEVALPQPERSPIWGNTSRFNAPPNQFAPHPRLITMVSIDPETRKFFVGDATENNLWEINHTGKILQKFDCGSTQPVAIQVDGDRIFCTMLGDYRGEAMEGGVVEIRKVVDANTDGSAKFEHKALISGFYRTSHSLRVDLNGDGKKDFVLSGYGDHNEGALAWFEALPDGEFEKHLLIGGAGALSTAAHDMDNDGDIDLLALIAQGRNEMYFLRNDGAGRFELNLLWKRGPGFGYNGFQIVDMDDDGQMDIVAVNGNNMEIRDPPLKPYHGVRIHMNRGDMNFEETFVFPFYGAIKAIARDFDQDGDLDIAAISAFPDWYARKPESFVYLEQQRGGEFRAYSAPETVGGRWLVMDAGDLDGDGDDDLILGGANSPPHLPNKFAREKAHKMILSTRAVRFLENKTVQKGEQAGDLSSSN